MDIQISQEGNEIAGPIVINDDADGLHFVVYLNPAIGNAVAFDRGLNGEILEFTKYSQANSRAILEDDRGNLWDIFGEGVSKGNLNQRLSPMNYMYGYTFALKSMFDTIEIFGDNSFYNDVVEDSTDSEWLITKDVLVFTGSLDLYSSLDNPLFVDADEIIRENHELEQAYDLNGLATVFEYRGQIRIFPHSILNYHEVVNDKIDNLYYALSFCPLTQTSQIWNRNLIQNEDFGVSGLVYNSNLVLYDRGNENLWSQIKQEPINTGAEGMVVETLSFVEMKLYAALQLTGKKMVLSTNTTENRDYNFDNYKYYRQNDTLLYYPILKHVSNSKTKVLAVKFSSSKVKIYGCQ